jgi:hypothetical protein
MTRTLAVALSVAIAGASPNVVRAECVDPPRKPIKVSGTLCGRVVVPHLTEPVDLEGLEMMLERHNEPSPYPVAETVTADSKGNFKFAPLAKGTYVLLAKGFVYSYPTIEVTKSTSKCGRQLFLVAMIGGDCRSYVTTKAPRDEWDD